MRARRKGKAKGGGKFVFEFEFEFGLSEREEGGDLWDVGGRKGREGRGDGL